MRPSFYLKSFPCDDRPGFRLLFSMKRGAITRVNDEVYRRLLDGTLPEPQAKLLAGLAMAVADPEAEKNEMADFFRGVNARSERLEITAVLNFDCNFKCVYCFEGDMKGSHYMTPQTADRLIGFIDKNLTGNRKDLQIDFYGGEPLLSPERIRYISEAAAALARERGGTFRSALVTNGSLFRRPVAEELAALGLERVRITLDGPAEIHDRSRPFKTGAGSFATIVRNIRETCDRVKIGLGGNYTRENYRAFVRLLDYLVETGLGPDRIAAIKFDPVMKAPAHGPSPPEYHGGCASINEPWIGEADVFLREEILKRGYRTPKIRPVTCMVELDHSFVVNYNGVIWKCPGFLGRAGFEAGDLENGVRDCRAAYRIDSWKEDACADCAYLPLCFGGCRYMAWLASGTLDRIDCQKDYLDTMLETLVKQQARYIRGRA